MVICVMTDSKHGWKYSLILFVVIFGIICLYTTRCSGQIHHDINDYFHDNGYVDRWTWSHVATGVIITAFLEWDAGWRWLYDKTGIEEPSAMTKLGIAFGLSAAWEMYEFSDANFNPYKYNRMYGGYALQNNGFDMFVQVGTTLCFLTDDLYWDYKIWKNR